MGRLTGKVALITGAAGGIGREVVIRFVEEGARLIALDLHPEPLEALHASAVREGTVLVQRCDVSEPADVRAAVDAATARFGRLDVLCSTAGGSSTADARVTDASEEEFWRVMRVDLFGTFLVSKYGIPALVAAGGGSVINLASMVALMGVPDIDCYTAAKGGIAALTRSTATEYGGDGVRVNAIAPGVTLTDRVAARSSSPGQSALEKRHLLGPLQPVDIAHMAVFLGSDESRTVTGQVLAVDSGVTIH